jgi:lysophospholipase L1-like esterase
VTERHSRPDWLGRMLRAGIALLPFVAMPSRGDAPPFFEADLGPDGVAAHALPVPEGSYEVTLRSKCVAGATGAVLAEQRRLVLAGTKCRGSKPVERKFVVNVRRPELGKLPDNATGGTTVRLKSREVGAANWDQNLSVETTGDARLLWMRAVPVTLPTLYLAGDSTVTDQPVAPNASWGQMLPRFFAATLAVANHAESGETLKSFVTEQRLDKLLSTLRQGDWVMIQFAHNDQKVQWPQTYAEAATTYRAWLRVYIAEVRRRGATPILVTSPDRRNFDAAGRIESTLGEYPEAMRSVAREERVAVIDLNAMSRQFYEALGPAAAARAFADGGRDKTHFNEYGGHALARCVVEGIRAADAALTRGLAQHLARDTGRFDPARPEPPPPPEDLT